MAKDNGHLAIYFVLINVGYVIIVYKRITCINAATLIVFFMTLQYQYRILSDSVHALVHFTDTTKHFGWISFADIFRL